MDCGCERELQPIHYARQIAVLLRIIVLLAILSRWIKSPQGSPRVCKAGSTSLVRVSALERDIVISPSGLSIYRFRIYQDLELLQI